MLTTGRFTPLRQIGPDEFQSDFLVTHYPPVVAFLTSEAWRPADAIDRLVYAAHPPFPVDPQAPTLKSYTLHRFGDFACVRYHPLGRS